MSVLLVAQLTDTHVVDPDADGNVPDEVYVDNNGRLALGGRQSECRGATDGGRAGNR